MGECDVLRRRHSWQEIELLKNETDFGASENRELVFVEARDLSATDAIRAGARNVEESQKVHQCRFAASRGAHDRDEVAVFDRHRDAAQSMNDVVAHAIGFKNVFDFEHAL